MSVQARAVEAVPHRGGPGGSPARRLGEILLARGAVSRERLEDALAAQRQSSLPIGELLVARGAVPRRRVADALAEQWQIGRADLAAQPPDPALAARADPVGCLRALAIPWRRRGPALVIALADPARAAEAAAAARPGGGPVEFALAEPAAIRAAIARSFRDRLRDRAVARTPAALSCRSWGRRRVPAALALVTALLLAGAALGWAGMLAGMLLGAVLLNAGTTALRLAAFCILLRRPAAGPPPGLPRLAERRPLPRISLLVPLYRETEMLDPLLAALAALDYPAELVDILLVLEEDDMPMRLAVAARTLPATVRTVIVPPGRPRTKPRALNYALDFADGEIVGIYDAEDRPDPGQLRAVAARFAGSPPSVACLQAELGCYNARQSWIARLFAIEYAGWFGVILKAVERLGLPVPLGGTSVFFRRGALEEVGAWDAHNVTEDADLGMRLARSGYRTMLIPSVTLEEAACRPRAWVRQRSRWLKGYMATWITHMRDPVGLWRDLGPGGFLGFQLVLLGGATAYLALPLLWLGSGLLAAGIAPPWVAAFPDAVLRLFWLSLAAGQAALLLVSLLALRRTGQTRLAPWMLASPFYWSLGALAAWKAAVELVAAPYWWDKTRHGFALQGRGSAAPSHKGGSGPSAQAVAAAPKRAAMRAWLAAWRPSSRARASGSR
jgi:cellulose synthase/poly-beta-1,6-N-acetylglucosamine synthase-like glycosyltransferase